MVLSVILGTRSRVLANAAFGAPAHIHVNIDIRMPLLAVCRRLVLVTAGHPALHVHLMRYCLQVLRIHARWHAAFVIQLQSLRHWPYMQLIRDDVRSFHQRILATATDIKRTVRRPHLADPQPASGVWLWHNSFHKPLAQSLLAVVHQVIICH